MTIFDGGSNREMLEIAPFSKFSHASTAVSLIDSHRLFHSCEIGEGKDGKNVHATNPSQNKGITEISNVSQWRWKRVAGPTTLYGHLWI